MKRRLHASTTLEQNNPQHLSSWVGHIRKKTVQNRRLLTPTNILIALSVLVVVIYWIVVRRLFFFHVETGYKLARQFRPIPLTRPLEDVYITLWLHQVHRWFGPPDVRRKNIRDYLIKAQNAGFTSVMGDLPWDWTERAARGDVSLTSWDKDWMEEACDLGMGLHVVIQMRNYPPWFMKEYVENVKDDETVAQWEMAQKCTDQSGKVYTHETPFIASSSPQVWMLLQEFVDRASQLLVEKYGSCLSSISPTMNNEFETKWSHMGKGMSDYSQNILPHWTAWQHNRSAYSNLQVYEEPPVVVDCDLSTWNVMDEEKQMEWVGFREFFLARQYERLCSIVAQKSSSKASCLLHFGEFFSTTDVLYSNLFFELAKSPHVGHIVMDSNMALSGAPSSPSIVGILVSTAKRYGKKVHYEAATERIMKCNDDGVLEKNLDSLSWEAGSALLLHTGIEYALEAGTDSIGITNLCAPEVAGMLFDSYKSSTKTLPASVGHSLYASQDFRPTAVIFVPYRAFYAWRLLLTGMKVGPCKFKASKCWHPTFSKGRIPRFGHGRLVPGPKNTCPVDVLQFGLIQLWDQLRTRHEHIAMIGDPAELDSNLLDGSSERYLVRFPSIMDGKKWSFFDGARTRQFFLERTKGYTFTDYLVTDELPC